MIPIYWVVSTVVWNLLCKSLIYFIWRQLVVVWSFDTFSSDCFPVGLRRTLEYFRFEMTSCWNRILSVPVRLVFDILSLRLICCWWNYLPLIFVWFMASWWFGSYSFEGRLDRLSNFDFLNLFLLSFLLCFFMYYNYCLCSIHFFVLDPLCCFVVCVRVSVF